MGPDSAFRSAKPSGMTLLPVCRGKGVRQARYDPQKLILEQTARMLLAKVHLLSEHLDDRLRILEVHGAHIGQSVARQAGLL